MGSRGICDVINYNLGVKKWIRHFNHGNDQASWKNGNWHRFDGRSEITWLPIFLMRKVCLSKEMWHSASAQTWKTMEDSKSEYTFPKAACEPTINHSLK